MKRYNEKLNKILTSILAVTILLSNTVDSNIFNFLIKQDCGFHRIELCSEHNYSHLVKNHIINIDNDLEVDNDHSTHDISHQIQIKKPYNNIKKGSNYDFKILSLVLVSNFINLSYDKRLHFLPDQLTLAKSSLTYLKTVRLII